MLLRCLCACEAMKLSAMWSLWSEVVSRVQVAQVRGEIRLWRAILQATEADLRAAFARKDRRAVQGLILEAEELRGVIADLAQHVRLAS